MVAPVSCLGKLRAGSSRYVRVCVDLRACVVLLPSKRQVVQHLVSSPFFRATAITPGLIWHLANFLTQPCKQDLQLNGLSEFRASLMGVLEQISQVNKRSSS
jgi:hypothetical protein